ncbi:alpha/beta hydrolase [bacterium]|nr:alpha/beta hydrolase [bacterium]
MKIIRLVNNSWSESQGALGTGNFVNFKGEKNSTVYVPELRYQTEIHDPAKPVIVFIPGAEAPTTFGDIPNWLVELGYDVFVAPLAGFGTRPERLRYLTDRDISVQLEKDLTSLLEHSRYVSEGVTSVYIVAASYGALQAVNLASKQFARTNFLGRHMRIVGMHLLSPAFELKDWRVSILRRTYKFKPLYGLLCMLFLHGKENTLKWYCSRANQAELSRFCTAHWVYPYLPRSFFGEYISTACLAQKLFKSLRCRVTVFYGRKDVLVRARPDLLNNTDTTTTFLENSGHFVCLDNSSREVRESIKSHVERSVWWHERSYGGR